MYKGIVDDFKFSLMMISIYLTLKTLFIVNEKYLMVTLVSLGNSCIKCMDFMCYRMSTKFVLGHNY